MDHHWDCRSWLQKPSTEIKWSKHVAKSSDSWLAAFRFVVSWTHLISLHQKKVPRATVHYLSEVTIRTILHTQVCPKILCPKIQRLHGKSSHYPHYVSKSSHFPHISPKFESKTPPFFSDHTHFPKDSKAKLPTWKWGCSNYILFHYVPQLSMEPSKAKLPSARGANLWPFRIVQFGATLIGATPLVWKKQEATHIYFCFLLVHISWILLDHSDYPLVTNIAMENHYF